MKSVNLSSFQIFIEHNNGCIAYIVIVTLHLIFCSSYIVLYYGPEALGYENKLIIIIIVFRKIISSFCDHKQKRLLKTFQEMVQILIKHSSIFTVFVESVKTNSVISATLNLFQPHLICCLYTNAFYLANLNLFA